MTIIISLTYECELVTDSSCQFFSSLLHYMYVQDFSRI